MTFRFTLLAVAVAFLTDAGLSQAQPMVVSAQFSGGAVTPIPAVVTHPQAIDPYATVATQSPNRPMFHGSASVPVLGNGPIFGNSTMPETDFGCDLNTSTGGPTG